MEKPVAVQPPRGYFVSASPAKPDLELGQAKAEVQEVYERPCCILVLHWMGAIFFGLWCFGLAIASLFNPLMFAAAAFFFAVGTFNVCAISGRIPYWGFFAEVGMFTCLVFVSVFGAFILAVLLAVIFGLSDVAAQHTK